MDSGRTVSLGPADHGRKWTTMSEQCSYMRAAYPDLDGEDTCEGFHEHEPSTFALATELARIFQSQTTKERTAWFLNDAQAVINQAGPQTSWRVKKSALPIPRGCDSGLIINGTQYLIPESEWEPSLPIKRDEWLAERDLTEEDIDDE